jgi:CheY-like chemotaxis protein
MTSRPGQGTRISLTLALAHAQAPAAVLAREESPPTHDADRTPPTHDEARDAGKLILVVDDHPVNRLVLLRQLEALGFAAISAPGALEAIEQWNRGGVGMILTDCNMPEMDGYELARHVRDTEARHGHRRVTIVACTANAFAGDSERCLAAGMDDYIAKPVLLEGLRGKMQRWLPEGRAESRDSSSALDPEVMRELSRGDADAARELLQEFWRYNGVDTLALRHALAASDWAGVARASHRVHGSSASIGAARLAHACEELERAGRMADAASVRTAMLRFDHELERLRFRIHGEPEKAA